MFTSEKRDKSGQQVANAATTQIIASEDVNIKCGKFRRNVSLVDTGTDAYLRQTSNMMHPLLPSSTVINTAGPNTITASHSGLLNILVKDVKNNMHQMRVENALIVPGLTQNLTSHKQFVENGHLVFFHKSGSGIVLNKQPKFKESDIVIPFVTGPNGLQYLEEFEPVEESAVAMVAERLQQLSRSELVHISLCHVSPTLMNYLDIVSTDIPKLRKSNFRCHCCVESKMKKAPAPPRSIRAITRPGEIISLDLVGPFRVMSFPSRSKYGLVFIDHFTNLPFVYTLSSKDEYPKFLQQFLIDFKTMFQGQSVSDLIILRSDNGAELNSAEVNAICTQNGIKRQTSNPGQQFQNGKAEKCIGDLWNMTKTSLLFSGCPRRLWEHAWRNACYVKRHLPCSANPGFQSPLQMIEGKQIELSHLLPFGCLMYIRIDKENRSDPKFDKAAQATVYVGQGILEGQKCHKGYTIDFKNKGMIGKILTSTNFHADLTYFPFRPRGQERVISLSGGSYLQGKDSTPEVDELPLPPVVESWMMYSSQVSDDQQEPDYQYGHTPHSQMETEFSTIPNEIVGYDQASDRYILRSAGDIKYVDSSELFNIVSRGDEVFVEGVKGSIPGFTISYGEDEDVFIKEGSNIYVNQITVADLKNKLQRIFLSTDSFDHFAQFQEGLTKVVYNDLLQADDEVRAKEMWNTSTTFDRSYSLPQALEHDTPSDVVHAYAARTIADLQSKDELTLTQALSDELERPLWMEAIKKELTSLILENEVFEPIEYQQVPLEKRNKIFNLLILLKRKRDQFGHISKHKARMVMDGSKAIVGVDVFDTYAPVIDYSTVRLLISLAFGNHWEMYHWDISVAFTNAKAEEETYVRFPSNFPAGLFSGYKGGTIARLKRNLYGSKSAPKLWYKCLREFIDSQGFTTVAGHPCLFIRVRIVDGVKMTIVIGVFVDDLLVTGNSLSEIEKFKIEMNKRFILTDQGQLQYYLGVEVTVVDSNTLKLHQSGYIRKIIETFGMTEHSSRKTPLPHDIDLSLKDCPDVVDPELQKLYRAIVGSLMYLYVWTRPDIGFAVTFLSRYLHKPGEKHMQAAKHVLRYLLGTPDYGMQYTRDLDRLSKRDQKLNVLYALSDSDFAGCKDTAKSTTGYMIIMNGAVVAYYSGRQTTVALCTAMAETIALAKVVVKVKHMRALLSDLQCQQEEETSIGSICVWVDNTAALAVANGNDFTHETVKHVTVKVRFLQECVQRRIILLAYVRTNQNISDIMTKQSTGPLYVQHRDYSMGQQDVIAMVAVIMGKKHRKRVTV